MRKIIDILWKREAETPNLAAGQAAEAAFALLDTAEQLRQIPLRNEHGNVVPFGSIAAVRDEQGQSLTVPSITIDPADGAHIIAAVDGVVAEAAINGIGRRAADKAVITSTAQEIGEAGDKIVPRRT